MASNKCGDGRKFGYQSVTLSLLAASLFCARVLVLTKVRMTDVLL